MKYSIRPYLLLFLFLFILPFNGLSQKQNTNDSLNQKLLNVAREIMVSAKTCALITVDKQNQPRTRMMDPFVPEKDFTVWLGTNPKSRKVTQIKNNPKVTLYYLDESNSGYVTLHGKAELVSSLDMKEKKWKENWEAFYPDKKENYLLIKVIPESIEVISYTHNIISTKENWLPPIVHFKN